MPRQQQYNTSGITVVCTVRCNASHFKLEEVQSNHLIRCDEFPYEQGEDNELPL